MAESLLPDTDAITKGTIEMNEYRGKWLVRWKEIDGTCHQNTFPYFALDEAFTHFLDCVTKQRSAIAKRKFEMRGGA